MQQTQPIEPAQLSFQRDGAQHVPSGLGATGLAEIADAIAGLPQDRAGIRLRGIDVLRRILSPIGSVGGIAAGILGVACRPVRAILFDKSAGTNWSLPWHQDRTISVVDRVEVDGFGPWTVKDGLLHVAPPFGVLAGMVTLRVHLDAVPATNAPLLVAPGSHRLGRIPEAAIPEAVQRCGIAPCLAEAGDIWIYATPILHASRAASQPGRRRVLQADFAAGDLPGGLRWLGI